MARVSIPSSPTLIFVVALTAAVLCVYLPGLHNELLFDDLRLADGTIFGQYGSVFAFRPRVLSYGSFVWVRDLLGDGWWKQRLVNVALHLASVAAIYALLVELFAQTRFAPSSSSPRPVSDDGAAAQTAAASFERSKRAALQVGVLLFALNPVAVYAVGYLTQRSIVMATLFSALACWCFVRALVTRRGVWHALALLAWVLALLSKEYAFLLALIAAPLYVHVRRPDRRTALALTGGALLLFALAALAVNALYGHLAGKLFDPRSVEFARQLEQIAPGITQRIWPLSIVNEAALFFRYGLLWFLPNVQWMSLDLRPAFPLSLAAFPQALGALSYLLLLAAAIWALLRARGGALGLAALLVLFPLLLYPTEFATVWVQDPFVLYRSYLWAIAVPGLVALALLLGGFAPRTIYLCGLVLGFIFAGLAFERVLSLKDEFSAWSDAAEKIDLQAPPNAVGRWRPFLNLGAWQLERGSLDQAARNFEIADALGDLNGNAKFNLGATLQQQKKHEQALAAFAAAESKGFSGQTLHYQRGESAMALGRFDDAYKAFSAGLAQPADTLANDDEGALRLRQTLRQRRADAAIATQRYDVAVQDFETLLKERPNDARLLLGLGMAQVGKGDTQAALALFDRLIARSPSAAAFYGRAVAHVTAGRRDAGLADLDRAIALDPRNAQYRQVRAQIAALPPG